MGGGRREAAKFFSGCFSFLYLIEKVKKNTGLLAGGWDGAAGVDDDVPFPEEAEPAEDL